MIAYKCRGCGTTRRTRAAAERHVAFAHPPLAGLVVRVRARSGVVTGLYRADEAGMEESDPECAWATVCEDHNCLVLHSTRAMARAHLGTPEHWCDVCRDGV